MEKYKDKYRIPSARYLSHDYNEGTYFITVCTHERKHCFGNIVDKEMHLSKLGRYVDGCICQIPVINKDVILHSYVVMPNHIHLVFSVQCGVLENKRQALKELSSKMEMPKSDVSTLMKIIANSCGKASHIISQMKSAVTRYAKKEQIIFAWQSRFHDHIIKDGGEFDKIMHYVLTNVENWEKDCFCIESV